MTDIGVRTLIERLPAKLLRRLLERLEQIEREKESADVVIRLQFHQGRLVKSKWNPDEDIR